MKRTTSKNDNQWCVLVMSNGGKRILGWFATEAAAIAVAEEHESDSHEIYVARTTRKGGLNHEER